MNYFIDIQTMTRRSFKLARRSLDGMITAMILPVTILLSFVFIFGGAIDRNGGYINYIVPGIIVMGIGQIASGTAVSLAAMKSKGVLNRFRTMDIFQPSVLLGEMNVTLIKSLVSVILVILVALLLDFRMTASFADALVLLLFVAAVAAAVAWLGFYIGLIASPEAAATFPMLFIFLPYISSGFVPIATMPRLLQAIARWSPFTSITEVIRGLLRGGLHAHDLVTACVWLLLVLIVGVGLTLFTFARQAEKR